MSEVPSAEKDVCRCEPYAYIGTQMAGTPIRCERCHGLVDDVAGARLDAALAEARARLTCDIPPAMTRAESDPHATNGRVSTAQNADGDGAGA